MSKSQQAKAVVSTSPSSFDLDMSLVHLLHRAQQLVSDLHFSTFGKDGLTPRQLALLMSLDKADNVSQTELVSSTGIDRSTLAEMVARLTSKGLIARAGSAVDKRTKTVTLAPEGKAALEAALPHLAAIDEAILARLRAKKRDTLLALLAELAAPKPVSAAKDATKLKKKDKKKKARKKKKTDVPNEAASDGKTE